MVIGRLDDVAVVPAIATSIATCSNWRNPEKPGFASFLACELRAGRIRIQSTMSIATVENASTTRVGRAFAAPGARSHQFIPDGGSKGPAS